MLGASFCTHTLRLLHYPSRVTAEETEAQSVYVDSPRSRGWWGVAQESSPGLSRSRVCALQLADGGEGKQGPGVSPGMGWLRA